MLAKLLRDHREALVACWLAKVRLSLRSEQPLDDDEVRDSLQFFIDELIGALETGQPLGEIGLAVASAHGAQRHVLKRDIADVVREYGLFFDCAADVCGADLPVKDAALLVDALNAGAAAAVREYAQLRDLELRRQAWEHFAFLAHEIRNPLQTARLAANLLATSPGERGLAVLNRSLAQVSETLDRALIEARLRGIGSGAPLRKESIDLRKLLDAALADSEPDAEAREIRLSVETPPHMVVEADARVLRSAIGNLVRNAVKFTHSGGAVTLRATGGRIEVEDQCGGLASGDEQKIFDSFRQSGANRSGFGLGLAIAREGIEAHGGSLTVRNVPGKGCVFVASLPT